MLNDTLNFRNMIILLIYLKKLGDRYHRCKCFSSHYGDEKYPYILCTILNSTRIQYHRVYLLLSASQTSDNLSITITNTSHGVLLLSCIVIY